MTKGSRKLPGLKGIEVPPDVAAEVDLPDDLDADSVGLYAVPSPRRRRTAGAVYLGGAVVVAIGAATGLAGGFWFVAAGLALIGVYHVTSAWDLAIREGEALEIANRGVEFGVGHASAQLAFEGWRAKPVWHLLVFSDDDPPTHRGLVRVSPLTGGVIDVYTEDIPAG